MTEPSDTNKQEAPSIVSKVLAHAKYAGAVSEDEYDYNGGFSYHAESHAFAVGFGVGMGASSGLLGDQGKAFVGSVMAAAFGLNRGPQLSSAKITEDIKQEPHYALMGLGIGLTFTYGPQNVAAVVMDSVPL